MCRVFSFWESCSENRTRITFPLIFSFSYYPASNSESPTHADALSPCRRIRVLLSARAISQRHHERDMPWGIDVFQRTAIHGDDAGPLAGLDGSYFIRPAKQVGIVDRGGLDRLQRRQWLSSRSAAHSPSPKSDPTAYPARRPALITMRFGAGAICCATTPRKSKQPTATSTRLLVNPLSASEFVARTIHVPVGSDRRTCPLAAGG